MKRGSTLFGVLVVLLVVSQVSAGIYFGDLDSVYNLGDLIDLPIEVDPILDGYLLRVDLECNGDTVLTFNEYPDATGSASVVLPLNINTIDTASGSCQFIAQYDDEERESNEFEISRRLEVSISSDSYFVKPGESIIVSGSAHRLNGIGIDGEVMVTIPLLQLLNKDASAIVEETEENTSEGNATATDAASNTTDASNGTEEDTEDLPVAVIVDDSVDNGVFYGKVVDGDFSVTIPLDRDIPAGEYRIDVLAYEGPSEEKTSEGIVMGTLKVFQVLTRAEIALNNQNFDPGTDLVFKPMLLDQSGLPIIDEVSVIIRDESGLRIFERLVQSSSSVVFPLSSNMTAGYYDLEISREDISAYSQVYVNEKAIVAFVLVNNTLIVENTGNIPYNKDVQIELNGKPFLKKVVLGLGESAEYTLTGENGEYTVKIGDGEQEIEQNGVMLTGRAVGVSEGGQSGVAITPLFWIFFVVLALGGMLIFSFRSTLLKKEMYTRSFSRRKQLMGGTPSVSAGATQTIRPVAATTASRAGVPMTHASVVHPSATPVSSSTPIPAIQTLVSDGNKHMTTVVTVKVKSKLGVVGKHALEHAIRPAYGQRGAVYEKGDYLFIMFSPLLTKQDKNEIAAAQIAQKIAIGLNAYNEKFAEKIAFGIAVHTGEVIDTMHNGTYQFTPLGSTLISSKRLAESSHGQILLSKDTYERGSAAITADKGTVNGIEVYEIKRIIDRASNDAFIKQFLERMKR